MTTGPREHPDADLLADLAAEVLPQDLARRVEAHVVDCDRCAGLLAEAEGIRGLLRREAPPVIPEDVADRIGAAIGALRLGPAAGDRAGPADDPDADARSAAATAPVTRLRRAATGTARPRRRSLDGQRSAGRVGRVLLAAAAVVVFVAVGGAAVRLLGDGGLEIAASSRDDAGSAASGDAAESGTAAQAPTGASGTGATGGKRTQLSNGEAPVLATGTDYTATGLEAQARQLLVAAAAAQAYAAGDGSAAGKPAPSPQASPLSELAPAAAPPGNQALRAPAALQACLRALKATDEQVVAVDLARYQGRDSAVIVLRAAGGAYGVWVVARDCRPGADGTLKYVPMTP